MFDPIVYAEAKVFGGETLLEVGDEVVEDALDVFFGERVECHPRLVIKNKRFFTKKCQMNKHKKY